MIRLALSAILAALVLPSGAWAERVTSREDFVALVQGRDLTTTGITLQVAPDGAIGGRAFGRAVSGTWQWDKGWFCRTLAWGSRDWPLNCQLVEHEGGRIVFTADKGAGDRATLTIR